MKKQSENMTENKKAGIKKIVIICLVVVAFLSCSFSYLATNETFAKYVTNFQSMFSARTSAFYFESSILSDDGTEEGNEYYVSAFVPSLGESSFSSTQPAGSYVAFTVYNYENQFNYMEEDVPYSVTITISGGANDVVLTKEDLGLDGKLYLAGGELSLHQYYLSVSGEAFENESESAIVTIEVVSESPYESILSGMFILSETSLVTVDASIEWFEYNEILTITTGNVGGEIFLTVPDDLIFDPTNNIIFEDWESGSSETVYKLTVSAYAEYELNLFKVSSENGVHTLEITDATEDSDETYIALISATE